MPRQGRGYALVFLLGLAVGVVGLVLALRALESRKTWQDRYPIAVMRLMSAHSALLRQKADANRCAPSDLVPHMQALRLLGNDLEPGFPELGSDRRFSAHASDFRRQLDQILADPPHTCALLEQMRSTISEACKACHRDFRN